MNKDLYKILDLTEKANISEINSAYKRQLKRYLKKLKKGDKNYKEKIDDLKFAFQYLSDSKKKKAYDDELSGVFKNETKENGSKEKLKSEGNNTKKIAKSQKPAVKPQRIAAKKPDFESYLTIIIISLFVIIFVYLKFS